MSTQRSRLVGISMDPVSSADRLPQNSIFSRTSQTASEEHTKWTVSEDQMDLILKQMVVDGPQRGDMPAGFTYLGQLITHDIVVETAPQASSKLPFRRKRVTPFLNFDSVFPKLSNPYINAYLDEVGRFRLGRASVSSKPSNDLSRIYGGTALIPEERNDENIIVSQLHLLLLRFHNKLVEAMLEADGKEGGRRGRKYYYKRARAFVILALQKVIVDEYLGAILHPNVYEYCIDGEQMFLQKYLKPDKSSKFRIPVEFSHAAFRLGHSMVLEKYQMNLDNRGGVDLKDIFRKGQVLESEDKVNWSLFFANNGCSRTVKNFAAWLKLNIVDGLLKVPLDKNEVLINAWQDLIVYRRDGGIVTSEAISQIVKNVDIGLMNESGPEALDPDSDRFSGDALVSHQDKFVEDMTLTILNLNTFANLLLLDIKSSRLCPTAGDLIKLFESKIVMGDELKRELFEGLSFNEYYQMVCFRHSVLDTVNVIENAQKKPISHDNCPLWLFILREAETLPNKPSSSGHQSPLGPLGSMVVGEVLRMSIDGAKLNIYQNDFRIKRHLGPLYGLYKREFGKSSEMIKISDFVNQNNIQVI